MANHFIDMELVSTDGNLHRLNDREAPNFFVFKRPPAGGEVAVPRGIITETTVKLFPLNGDEQAISVPCSNFEQAIALLKQIGRRKIGLGAAIMSLNFFTMFASPTFESSFELKAFLKDQLGVEHLVMVLGDKYAIDMVKEIAEVTVGQDLAKIFMLGVTDIYREAGTELLSHVEGNQEPYKALFQPELIPLWEMILSPSPDNLAQAVDEDMKDFFRELYSRPQMTDLFWLNKFRPLSSRMGRNHSIFAAGLYGPLEGEALIEQCKVLQAMRKM